MSGWSGRNAGQRGRGRGRGRRNERQPHHYQPTEEDQRAYSHQQVQAANQAGSIDHSDSQWAQVIGNSMNSYPSLAFQGHSAPTPSPFTNPSSNSGYYGMSQDGSYASGPYDQSYNSYYAGQPPYHPQSMFFGTNPINSTNPPPGNRTGAHTRDHFNSGGSQIPSLTTDELNTPMSRLTLDPNATAFTPQQPQSNPQSYASPPPGYSQYNQPSFPPYDPSQQPSYAPRGPQNPYPTPTNPSVSDFGGNPRLPSDPTGSFGMATGNNSYRGRGALRGNRGPRQPSGQVGQNYQGNQGPQQYHGPQDQGHRVPFMPRSVPQVSPNFNDSGDVSVAGEVVTREPSLARSTRLTHMDIVDEPETDVEVRSKKALKGIRGKKSEKSGTSKASTVEFPLRMGAPGTPQTKTLKTNHFEISIDNQVKFYEYELIGLPVGINRTRLRKFFLDAIQQIPWLRTAVGKYATDNLKTIIAWENLHDGQVEKRSGSIDVELTWGPFDVPEGKKQLEKKPETLDEHELIQPTRPVSIKFLRTVDVGLLRKYVEGSSLPPSLWTSSSEVKAVNIVISSCFDTTQVFQYSANRFYISSTRKTLRPRASSFLTGQCDSLDTMHGYFYTIKPVSGGILLNVNFSTGAFFEPKKVSDFLSDSSTFKSEAKRQEALIGLRAKITYARGKSEEEKQADWEYEVGRIKMIQGVGLRTIREQTFKETPQSNPISVENYLKRTYQRAYTDDEANTLAINLGSPGKESWHSASDLEILPNQLYSKPVPDHLTDAMLREASIGPAETAQWIQERLLKDDKFLKIVAQTADQEEETESFVLFEDCLAVQIKPELMQIQGSTLPYPPVLYKTRKGTFEGPETEYSLYTGRTVRYGDMDEVNPRWNLVNRRFLRTGQPITPIRPILLIAPDLQYNGVNENCRVVYEYRKQILSMLGTYGWSSVNEGDFAYHYLASTDLRGLHDGLELARQVHGDASAKVVFLLLQKKNIQIYQAFKSSADREFGLHSICITEAANIEDTKAKYDKRQWVAGPPWLKHQIGQYFGNIMMKVNLKMGGINHSTKIVRSRMSNTLVLGADVTHPGPGAIAGCPSIAAIVGSVEDNGGKFLGSMRLQSKGRKDREIIDDVEHMVAERLRSWSDAHRTATHSFLPENIIYYRDGVSEGQYMKVKNEEVSAIRRAYSTVAQEKEFPKQDVKITAVIAAKRHHTRFFPTHRSDEQGKAGNCMPGTLVEDKVTSPYFTDFYLQSHSGLQGTARPTHYFLLEDEIQMGIAEFQKFTHELCYTYVRATIGVSYASPAYYADRLCDRGRAYIREYMVGNKDRRHELNEAKKQWTPGFAKLRERLFGEDDGAETSALLTDEGAKSKTTGSKAKDKKMRRKKTEDEEYYDIVEREMMDAKVRKWVMARVQTIWGSLDANPWHERMNGTMFWM